MEEQCKLLRIKENEQRTKYEPNHRCLLTYQILEDLRQNKHVYIQGEPGYGKTELIDNYLTGKNYWKPGETSQFLFGTIPEKTDYIWFEDFDLTKYHQNLNNILSLMDKKETTISKKCCDDRTIITNATFIFTSNFCIGSAYSMFERRISYHHVCHKMYNCGGCRPDYTPSMHNSIQDLPPPSPIQLELSDEYARDGLNNIMTPEEI